MRKLTVLLLVLIAISAGCIGGTTPQTQSPTASQTGSTQSTSSVTSTATSAEKTSINPFQALQEIKQYTYTENASVELRINMTAGNITQQTNVSLVIEERGYVDLDGMKARIQTRTTTLPDNVTLNTTWVVIGKKVYVENFGNVTVENNTAFWRVNPVSLARELLKLKPVGNYTENGTLVLVYSVPEELILPLAGLYFTTPEMNTTVTDATAELYFTEKGFTGMKLTYGILATTTTNGIGGEIKVTERGLWKGTIRITSVNKKEDVKAPST
ncbi:hypothetical protein [Thermococcus nautili]|uniref:Uncharacterized protein n=1 Tax=Thermococcus nautili TaxID=195522 RepID=W8NW85_9EURY|nr:hypothetical protein [Thermococcus nautili]AHL23457.1 hypothetical protein BD01_1855 [Thermococcus nautili]